MFKLLLLGAASAGILCHASLAQAQESTTAITGGGSQSTEFDYFGEFATFNASQAAGAPTFANPSPATGNEVLFWASGSGAGQQAFLNDDISCDANKVTGANNKLCSGTVGGAASVDYGASDNPLTTTQIAQWGTSSVGSAVAGHLIQLPSLGTAQSIIVVNASVTANGAISGGGHTPAGGVVLTDSDLCGIFSGKLTNWNQTSAAAKLTAGTINVVYRSDSSGATFILLNHLSAVCTTSNSSFATIPLVPNNTFITVFGTSPVPANFVPQGSASAVASYLDNATGVTGAPTVTSGIGYDTADYTTVDPNSSAVLADGSKSTLVVAAIQNGKLAYIPDVTDITNALNHPKQGTTLKPPATAAAGANPVNFVPVVQTTTLGYPIVGYTTFDFAQCYATPAIATAILSYLTAHYNGTAAYATTEKNNGFVAIGASGAKAFVNVIQKAILTNADKWNDNIQNTTVCSGAGVTGR